MPCVIDERERECQSPGIQLWNKVCNDSPYCFIQRDSSGKKRRSVSIVPEAEKNQIMPVNRFASLRGQKIELILIFLRRRLWIDFTAHTQD